MTVAESDIVPSGITKLSIADFSCPDSSLRLREIVSFPLSDDAFFSHEDNKEKEKKKIINDKIPEIVFIELYLLLKLGALEYKDEKSQHLVACRFNVLICRSVFCPEVIF